MVHQQQPYIFSVSCLLVWRQEEDMTNNSEVARLLQQINEEFVAGQRGLSEYATVSRHDFINNRYHAIGAIYQELIQKTQSKEEATRLISESLDALPEER